MDTTSLQMLHLCVKRTWKFAQHELTACIIYCKCNTERNYSLQIWFLKSLNYSSMTELQSIGYTVATKKAEAIFLHWKFDSLKHIIARENGGRTKFQKKLFSNLTMHIYMSSFAYISRLFYVGNPEKNYVSSLYTGIPNKTMPLSVLEGFYKAVVIIAHIYVTFSVWTLKSQVKRSKYASIERRKKHLAIVRIPIICSWLCKTTFVSFWQCVCELSNRWMLIHGMTLDCLILYDGSGVLDDD